MDGMEAVDLNLSIIEVWPDLHEPTGVLIKQGLIYSKNNRDFLLHLDRRFSSTSTYFSSERWR